MLLTPPSTVFWYSHINSGCQEYAKLDHKTEKKPLKLSLSIPGFQFVCHTWQEINVHTLFASEKVKQRWTELLLECILVG